MSLLRRKPNGTYETFYGEIEAEAYELDSKVIAKKEAKETRGHHMMNTGHHPTWMHDTFDTLGWLCDCGAQYPPKTES